MKLTALSDPIMVIESHLNESRALLRESIDGLDINQRLVAENTYELFIPLIEATLSSTQVQDLFKRAESEVTASGSNRTALGRGVDAVKAADNIINKLGKTLQDTTPVKYFDNKYEDLKKKIIDSLGDDSKLVAGIAALGNAAKKHPGKTAAVIGILTAIAGLGGGPASAAIAGHVLRSATELIKGEKLSTAVGKGIKTAAYSWLAGKTIEEIGEYYTSGIGDAEAVAVSDGISSIDYVGFKEIEGRVGRVDSIYAIGKTEDIELLDHFLEKSTENWMTGNYVESNEWIQQAKRLAEVVNSDEYQAQIDAMYDANFDAEANKRAWKELLDSMSAAASAAAAGATAIDQRGKPVKTESEYYQLRPLTESQVHYMFKKLDEASIFRAAADKIKTVGKNLTTSITADKLSSKWKKAGSPTDSDEIADFLEQQGIDVKVINHLYKQMSLPHPGTASSRREIQSIKDEIDKLDPLTKKKLIKIIQKNLGEA